MGGYAKLSVNNIIAIEEESMKGSRQFERPKDEGWLSCSHSMVSKIYSWMIGLLSRGNYHYQQRKCN
jgi:hypothetical protein